MANFKSTNSDQLINPEFVLPTITKTGATHASSAADVIDAGCGSNSIENEGRVFPMCEARENALGSAL